MVDPRVSRVLCVGIEEDRLREPVFVLRGAVVPRDLLLIRRSVSTPSPSGRMGRLTEENLPFASRDMTILWPGRCEVTSELKDAVEPSLMLPVECHVLSLRLTVEELPSAWWTFTNLKPSGSLESLVEAVSGSSVAA